MPLDENLAWPLLPPVEPLLYGGHKAHCTQMQIKSLSTLVFPGLPPAGEIEFSNSHQSHPRCSKAGAATRVIDTSACCFCAGVAWHGTAIAINDGIAASKLTARTSYRHSFFSTMRTVQELAHQVVAGLLWAPTGVASGYFRSSP